MNIHKSVTTFLVALSIMALTSCNFIENLAVENVTEVETTQIVDENVTTDDYNEDSQTEDETTTTTTTDTSTSYEKSVITTAVTSTIDLSEITLPEYNENYVTTTEQPSLPAFTYSTDETYTTESSSTVDTSYLETYCAFIGDSLTVGLSAYGFIPEEHTFAKEGITLKAINSLQLQTDNGYLYPAQAIASWKLKEVYILLGINGVSWIDNDEAISEYTTLINNIRQYDPSIQINVISVLPVAYSMETISTVADGRILNSEVDAFNQRLQSMATQLGCHYVDANSSMKNQSGYLPDDITFDGLHLTMSGYQKLVEILAQDVNRRN